MIKVKRIVSIIAAAALCTALAFPAGAAELPVTENAVSTVQAQSTSPSKNFVGKKQIFYSSAYYSTDSGTKTKHRKIDLTGDNKNDTVKIKATNSDDGFSTKLTVTINGKKAFSKTLDTNVYVTYIRQSKSKEFLCIKSCTDNGYCATAGIYKYDKSTGKLKKVLSMDYAIGSYDPVTIKVTKSKLIITNTYRDWDKDIGADGHIYCIKNKRVYKYKNGKFKLIKKTTKSI